MIRILCPLTCPFFWVNCCSVVCRKCTVEKKKMYYGGILHVLSSSWHPPGTYVLALEMCSDMSGNSLQWGSMHIPTVTFYHFDSVHFTSCMTQSFYSLPPHKLKYGGYWGLSWRTGGSEDDNEKLDDLRVPPCRLLSVSLRPLTLSSAFDQLQVQPRLWYPSLFAQTCH